MAAESCSKLRSNAKTLHRYAQNQRQSITEYCSIDISGDQRHSSSLWFCPRFCPCPHFPHVLPLMFALALALYIAMTRNGNWEGKGKGKHWWQNMEEMGARAKKTPQKMGQKNQSRGQGQGQKLMTKHEGNGGKGKNDTLKIGQKYEFWGQGQGQNLDKTQPTPMWGQSSTQLM